MTKLALLAIALTACTTNAPALTYRLSPINSADPEVAAYHQGAHAWSEVGAAEVALTDVADLTVYVWRAPSDDVTRAHIEKGNVVVIDPSVHGADLVVLAAHMVGHVLLDSPEHTLCGVMGLREATLCDDDRALACRVAGLCD